MSGSAGSLHLFDEYYSSSATDHFYTSNPGGENISAYSLSVSNAWTTFMGSNSKGIVGSVSALWRYYNPVIKDHYYSTASNIHEIYTDWVREGAVGYVYTSSGSNRFAVYSHWDGTTDHKFSTSSSESGFTQEGIAWYSPSIVSGCGDSSASNYNAYVNQSNTGCTYPVYGCTDPSADNYDSSADTNDGSCTYSGCTDPNANNYDSNADNDDGSCTYTPQFDHGFRLTSTAPNGAFSDNITVNEGVAFQMKLDWHRANNIKNTGYRIGFEFQENDGSSTASLSDFNGSTSAEYSINSNSGYVTYSATAKEDISISEGTETMRVAFYTRTSASAPKAFYAAKTVTVNDTSVQILGCTDSTQFNYDPNANTDDGSCVPFIYGCIDSIAENYDSNANTDDGSCYYTPDIQTAGLSPLNVILIGGGEGNNVAGQSSTLTVEWIGNKSDYDGGNNNTTDTLEIYRRFRSSNVLIGTSSSSDITFLQTVGNRGKYRYTQDYTLSRSNCGSGNIQTSIPFEYHVVVKRDNTYTDSSDVGGTGTYVWYYVPNVDPSTCISEPQMPNLVDGETRTLTFKYAGYTTPRTIYWSVQKIAGSNTVAQTLQTTSGSVTSSLDNTTYSYDVGTFDIDLTALNTATTETQTLRLRLRFNSSSGSVVWQEQFLVTEPAPAIDTFTLTDINGSAITQIPIRNSTVGDDPFYHFIANWTYALGSGTPSQIDKAITTSTTYSTTLLNPGDITSVTFENEFVTTELRDGSLTDGDNIQVDVTLSNPGGSANPAIGLSVYDPVVINNFGFTQTTILNASAYTSSGTPTLRATVGQTINFEFDGRFISQWVATRIFEGTVITIQTVGDQTTNDLNSPNPYSSPPNFSIEQPDLPIGVSEIVLTAYGHAGGSVTKSLIVESYEPVSLTASAIDTTVAVGESTTISLAFDGSTDGGILMMPGSVTIPLPSSGNIVTVTVNPKITTNYQFTLNGLGGDTATSNQLINAYYPPQIDYFAPTQNPIQKGDNYGVFYGVSGNYQSITIDGVPMSDNAGKLVSVAPNTDGNTTRVITVVGLGGESVQKSFTITTKDVFYGDDTQGSEDILFNDIVRGGDFDPSHSTPKLIFIPANNKNTKINVCSAAGGNGAPAGDSPSTTGSAGGKGYGATFYWPDYDATLLEANPGLRGQTRTTSCTSCSSSGGDGLYGAADSGFVSIQGGSGGGGGAASGVYEGDNLTVIIEAGGGGGGGGASAGGYSGIDGETSSSWSNTQETISHYAGSIGNNGANGGSGGGSGGGATTTSLPADETRSAAGTNNVANAGGGNSGRSIYRGDIVSLVPSDSSDNLGETSTYGDGWVWVQYEVGAPKINTFNVTPQNNVGSNLFDISWDTEGMFSVEVKQDSINTTLSDNQLSGEILQWSSNLVSIANVYSPAVDSFTITAIGYDSNTYTQTINVTVINDATPDTADWEETNETEPSQQITQNLGNLVSELPITLYNEVGSSVDIGPSNSGPWGPEWEFQPGQSVWIRYFSKPFNTNVNDENTGQPLTGLYGNTNNTPIRIYAGGRWFPQMDGTSVVVSGAGPYGEPGKGELGGIVSPGDTKGILLMGSYGDTEHVPVRTASWSKDTSTMKEIRINHISGIDSNGGERPNNNNEVLELVIDPNDGSTPRVVELVPHRNSVTTPASSPYFISGNRPQYYPCAARPGDTFNGHSWNADGTIVFCWYTTYYQLNNYDNAYGNWTQTGVTLLANEKTPNTTFTLRSYSSAPEFTAAIPTAIAENNQNAGDIFAINQVIYLDDDGVTVNSDQPGSFQIDFLAKTRPPRIHEDFNAVGTQGVDVFPDRDFNSESSSQYLVSNQIIVDDIELFRSDQALEIRTDDPNAQVKINSDDWKNTREIGQ